MPGRDRQEGEVQSRTVVVAVDCQETDDGNVDRGIASWVANHALRDGDDVLLVTVLEGPVVDTPFSTMGDASIWAVTVWERHRKHEEGLALMRLGKFTEMLRKSRWKGAVTELVLDDPAPAPSRVGIAISEYVEAVGAALLVMPNTPPPANLLKRKLSLFHGNGSASEYCSRNVRCPVMLVHGGANTAADLQPAMLVESVGDCAMPMVAQPNVQLKPRRLCLAAESPQDLRKLMAWGSMHFINQNWDEIHVVCIQSEVRKATAPSIRTANKQLPYLLLSISRA